MTHTIKKMIAAPALAVLIVIAFPVILLAFCYEWAGHKLGGRK